MAECQTPGANYTITTWDSEVFVRVDLPMSLHLDEAGAKALEARLHTAVEAVLAPYFVTKTTRVGGIRQACEGAGRPPTRIISRPTHFGPGGALEGKVCNHGRGICPVCGRTIQYWDTATGQRLRAHTTTWTKFDERMAMAPQEKSP